MRARWLTDARARAPVDGRGDLFGAAHVVSGQDDALATQRRDERSVSGVATASVCESTPHTPRLPICFVGCRNGKPCRRLVCSVCARTSKSRCNSTECRRPNTCWTSRRLACAHRSHLLALIRSLPLAAFWTAIYVFRRVRRAAQRIEFVNKHFGRRGADFFTLFALDNEGWRFWKF